MKLTYALLRKQRTHNLRYIVRTLLMKLAPEMSKKCATGLRWRLQGPISSIKLVRYILNCAYVVFWEVRTSVSSKHLKLFVRTKICVSLKNVVFLLCLTPVSKYHVIGHVRTLYSRVKWFNTEWKIRTCTYVKKVLKKKHAPIRMKAGGPDLHPLENHIQDI